MSIADLFMHQILSALNIDKEEILPMVQNIGQTVQNFDAKLSRIEENQRLIMEALKIEQPAIEAPQNENEYSTDDIPDHSEVAE